MRHITPQVTARLMVEYLHALMRPCASEYDPDRSRPENRKKRLRMQAAGTLDKLAGKGT